MVSKANRYESIETENHRHESKKHAEKAEKIRVSTSSAGRAVESRERAEGIGRCKRSKGSEAERAGARKFREQRA